MDLFEQIFSKILEDYMKYKLVDTEQIFMDATHVKAYANSKKWENKLPVNRHSGTKNWIKKSRKTELHMIKTVER